MRRSYKKVLAMGLSCAMVVSSVNLTGTTVKADMSINDMVKNATYNVALKKTITANPSKGEGSEEALSDGEFTPGGTHAATTFATAGTYYEIDLGDVYDASTLDKLVVGYKENNAGDTPVNGYQIQYSPNGLAFNTVKTVAAGDVTGQLSAQNLIEEEDLAGIEGKVRYIRVLYPQSYTWGIQATEIAVLDTDGNLAKAEANVCADAKSVTAASDDYNKVTYTIEAGENQEEYKYIVYLQSGSSLKRIGNAVDAGKAYTVEGVAGGTYQLKVVACVGDSASAGILSEEITVKDISSLIQSTKNVSNNTKSPYNPQIVEMKTMYNGHSLTTAQKALDGKLSTGEGSDVALRTAAGSPQYFVINLGEYYTPAEMERVILAYTNANTYASDAKVEFSLDGENYTEVGKTTGYAFKQAAQNQCALCSVALDKIGDYTPKAVRFVKITLSGGTSTCGYVVNEAAVIANTDEPTIVGSDIPNAADVTVTQNALEEFSYSITAGEEQDDASYVVYLGSEVINNNAKAGEVYTQKCEDAGTYTIKVCTYDEGWLSKGIEKRFVVDGYTNYINTSYNVANPKIDDYNPQVVEVSSLYQGHTNDTAQKAVDGNLGTGEGPENCLRTGSGSPQSFVVDLGRYYKATDLREIMLEYTNAATYAADTKVEFSRDRANYTEVGKVTGYNFGFINQKQYGLSRVPLTKLADFTDEAVRYVKVTLSGGASDWGYVVNEVAVMANNANPTVIEANVSEAAEIKLSQGKLESIDYEIVAGEEQEDATYVVSLGSNVINSAAKAGVKYTYEGVEAGKYTVTVCQTKDGWLSKGIQASYTVDGYVNYIGTSLNLALKKNHGSVTVTADSDNINDPIGQQISGGVEKVNNGVWWDYGHHTGYLQTRPDTKTVNVDYDLGKDYKPEEITSVISMYADEGTAATAYEIFFSGDGENFESVYSVKDAKFQKFMIAKVDTSSYTQETVRYVKYRMLDGKFRLYTELQPNGQPYWEAIGYLLCELAVMGNETLLPDKMTEFSVSADDYNAIDVQWTDLEGEGYTYGIYVDETLMTTYGPGVGTARINHVRKGNHEVQVSVIKGEMERLSDVVVVNVQEEPTTKAPTTAAPATTKKPVVATTKKPVVATTKPVIAKPAKTSVKKIKVKKKKASLTLKKVKGVTGYRIKYSTKKDMKKSRMVSGSYKLVVKKLKSKKRYYFAAQTYITKNGVTVYSDWSAVKRSKKIK